MTTHSTLAPLVNVLRRLGAITQGILSAPWGTYVREVLRTRYVQHGDIRLVVMDIRPKRYRNPTAIVVIVSEALARLSAAGQGFGELVTSHLEFVVAREDLHSTFQVSVRAYVSDFHGHEGRNAHYLACELIWAATAVRLAWDARRHNRPVDVAAARQACWEAQKRFVSQFEGAYEWIEYLDPDRPSRGPNPPTGAA